MSDTEAGSRTQLEARLRQIESEFEREMRARGFDPAQDENVALTSSLARLYTEREQVQDALRNFTENSQTKDEKIDGERS